MNHVIPEWIELTAEGKRGFACNTKGCPNHADMALTTRPDAPDTNAMDVRCYEHCPKEVTE